MTRAAPRRRAEPVRRRDKRAARREETQREERGEVDGHGGGGRRARPAPTPLEPARPTATASRRPVAQKPADLVPTPTPALVDDLHPPVRRTIALEGPSAPSAVEPSVSTQAPWWELTLWSIVLLAGAAALVAGLVPAGPSWLPGLGALAVATTYTWVVAARSGGRPVVFTALTFVVGAATLVLDRDELRTGAAVVTAVVAAVLAVVITVPAVRFVDAAREACIAAGVAGLGGLAALGFEPQVDVGRFEYVTLVLSLLCAFTLVYRLGAGLHGLGTRGLLIVIVGAVTLAVTLAYAEMLRRYGTPDLVTTLLDAVHWSREHLGAFPRPIEAVLGIPALVWGTHMRARRRQGWWVCAFGVAGTAAISDALVNPAISVTECALSVLYGLVVGLLLGYVVIRIDLALTGAGGGRRAVGRTGRRAEEAEHAVRPEPKRTDSLL